MKYLAIIALTCYATTGVSTLSAQASPLLIPLGTIPPPLEIIPPLEIRDYQDVDFAIFSWFEEVWRWDDMQLKAWLAMEQERNEEWFAAERANAARPTPPPKPAPVARPVFSGDVWQIIYDAAVRWHVDPALFARIAGCESGGNPNAENRYSDAKGLFQHLLHYWAARAAAAGLPGASVFDPYANAEVSARMIATGGTDPWLASKSCWAAW